MIEFNKDDIKEVMEITGLDESKATKLFKSVAKDIDDGFDDEVCSYDVIEIIKTENKVKASGSDKVYAKAEKKPKAKREVKLDDTKVSIIKSLAELLAEMPIENITIANPQKEIAFTVGGDHYSLNLVKHRPPKVK